MKDKIIIIILTIVFIGLLVGMNFFLKEETNKKLNGNDIELNQNTNNKEEESKMNILKVTGENFEEEVLKSEKTVLIDFYAEWCGPCKMMAPIIEKVAENNEDVKVVKINVDEAQDIAMKYQVMSIPTLVVIKDGKEAKRSVGLIGQDDIENLIK